MNRYESLAIMQLSECASWREVQNAYKHQLVKWHPDKFNSSALMASYTEEKCKVASEAFLYLKELYQQGVLPMRPVHMSPSSTSGASCNCDNSNYNSSDVNGLCHGMGLWAMGHRAMPQGFEDTQKSRFDRRPKDNCWKRNLYLGIKERVCDVIGLILLPLEFALCLLKVIAGNVAVFAIIFAPLLSGYVAMNTLLAAGERVEDVASAISVATMGSNYASSGKEVPVGVNMDSFYVNYKKLKGQFISMLQGTR